MVLTSQLIIGHSLGLTKRRIKRVESIFTKASTSFWSVKLLECLPNNYSSSGDHVQ